MPEVLLAATAKIYGQVLLVLDFQPELASDEEKAITLALDAVAKKYLTEVKHLELYVLAMAMGMPVLTRLPERQRRKAEEAKKTAVERIVKEPEPKPVVDERPLRPAFVAG